MRIKSNPPASRENSQECNCVEVPFHPDAESLTDHEMKILQAKSLRRGQLTVCSRDILRAAIIICGRRKEVGEKSCKILQSFPVRNVNKYCNTGVIQQMCHKGSRCQVF